LRVFLAKMLLARSVGIIFQSSYWHFTMCIWILQPNKHCIHPLLHTHSTHLISVSKLTVENSHNIRFKRRLKRIREENVQVYKDYNILILFYC
jgi:hypothetical protein